MDDVREDIAALRALVEGQQQRIADLEGRLAARPEMDAGGRHTRRNILMGAAAVVAGGAAAVAGSPAGAADTDPLTLGQDNTAEHPTTLTFDDSIADTTVALTVKDSATAQRTFGSAILGIGNKGSGFRFGVVGDDQAGASAPSAGVAGLSSNGVGVGGIGLAGQSIGVQGQGPRLGVYGGAVGTTPKNIGVGAEAGGYGTALAVLGVLRASRTGTATVPAGKRFVLVNLTPVFAASALVFANLQPYTGTLAVAGVAVGTNKFTVYLTAPAPAGGVKVGWVVIDKIAPALIPTAAPAGEMGATVQQPRLAGALSDLLK